MATSMFDTDFKAADALLGSCGLLGLRDAIARAIASERQRCFEIASALDSRRGNEEMIANAIMSKPMPDLGDSKRRRSTVSE